MLGRHLACHARQPAEKSLKTRSLPWHPALFISQTLITTAKMALLLIFSPALSVSEYFQKKNPKQLVVSSSISQGRCWMTYTGLGREAAENLRFKGKYDHFFGGSCGSAENLTLPALEV